MPAMHLFYPDGTYEKAQTLKKVATGTYLLYSKTGVWCYYIENEDMSIQRWMAVDTIPNDIRLQALLLGLGESMP